MLKKEGKLVIHPSVPSPGLARRIHPSTTAVGHWGGSDRYTLYDHRNIDSGTPGAHHSGNGIYRQTRMLREPSGAGQKKGPREREIDDGIWREER